MEARAGRSRSQSATTRTLLMALSALLCFVSGCEAYFSRIESRIPDEIRSATAGFVETLRRGRVAETEAGFSPEAWNEQTEQFLTRVSRVLSAQPEYELKPGTYEILAEDGDVYHTFRSQIGTGDRYRAVKLTFREKDGSLLITGVAFVDLPGDLEEIHGFTLAGRGPVLWIIFFAAVAIPIFVLWSLADCWKSGLKLRWLWIPVILVCFPMLAVDWSAQQASLSAGVLLLGADYFQPSRLSPAIVSIGLPIGAIAWQLWRRVRRAGAGQEPEGEAGREPAADA